MARRARISSAHRMLIGMRAALSLAISAALLVVPLLCTPSAASPSPAQPTVHKFIVDATDTNAIQALTQRGGKRLVDYGPFSLWLAPDAMVRALSLSPGATERDDLNRIDLRGGAFIDTGGSLIQAAPKVNGVGSRTSGGQFWMVQFIGPIVGEWVDDLTATGVRVVIYMPGDAYVVWGDAASLDRLDALAARSDAIQWTGPYLPSYRLAPDLAARAQALAPAQWADVTVQIFDDDVVDQTLARLRAFGGNVYAGPERILDFINVSLQIPTNQLSAVSAWADVFNVEPYVRPQPLDEVQDQILAGAVTTSGGNVLPTGPGYLNWLLSKGFPTTAGSYPIVSIVDDGIDQGDVNNVLHPDFHYLGSSGNASRVVYIDNCTTDAAGDSADGHGNINAGIVGSYNNLTGSPHQDTDGYRIGLGVSPFGRIGAVKIFANGGVWDSSQCSDGSDAAVVAASYNSGAALTSNSWGGWVEGFYAYYDTEAQAYDFLTRDASSAIPGNQEMLHVVAAGNQGSYGSRSINTPGTAKNVLTVGATENVRDNGISDGCGISAANSADDIIYFSSRGPTYDGRIKPDLMAPGTHVQGPASQDPAYNGSGVCGSSTSSYYPLGQTLYTWSSGTSHSTPALAGAASLAYEYYGRVLAPGYTPSAAMLKALLINSARYLTGVSANDTLPSNNQGWGDANLGMLFDGLSRQLVNESVLFTATGQVYTTTGYITDPTRPFRVTLAWTDAPGTATSHPWVNNLNLVVIVNGTTYYGNVFSGQYSIVGGSSDYRNNVENVFIPAGVTGPYEVQVIAANIAGNGVPGNASARDQDFALVVNGPGSPAPALAVHKSAAPDPVQAGATLTYTLRVTNTGNVTLHAAITDTLPPQVTSPGPLAWSPIIAAPNGVWTQQVTGTVQLGYSGPLTNVLRATSLEGATGMVTVTTQAATTPALATHKSAAPDPVQAGATLTYTLRVTNTGNVTLHAAITDTLPPQVTSPGPLTWSPLIAAPNGVWTQQVTGTVQLGYSGPLTNVLRVTSPEGATGMVTVTTQAATTSSLAVTKSAAPDPVQAGATLTYTLLVTNTGNVALHAAITDTLPPQVTSPGPLTWSPLIAAPNGVWTQQVTGTVQLGYSGPLTNVLRVTSLEGATGIVTVTTQAATTPALAVTKSAAPDPVQAGATLTYTLLVTNTGNVTLHAAITDTLPPQVTSPGPLTWSPLIAAPNGVWTQQVTGTVQLGYSGPLTNVLRVTSLEGATGIVTVTTQAATTPALAVHKSAASDPVQSGATLTYTLLVTNTGNVALHAAITDTLPPQVTSPGPLAWSPVIAAPNGVWTQQVTGTVQLGYSGPLTNVLRVTSPEGAMGMVTVTTQAATTSSLAVTKSAAPDPVQAGATLTYTLRVTNTGNVALHAAITDTLPPQVTSPGPLTWTGVALAPGATWSSIVTGTVQPGYSGPLTNVIRVISLEGATGAYTVTTQAATTPSLAVHKSAAPDPVQAGATLTYTLLVTNTGNVTLHAAITDTLPPQVTSPGPLTWSPLIAAPNGVWTQQVTGTVQLGYNGPLTNVLRVTSLEGATGAYTATTQAATTPALAVTKSAAPDPVQAGATLTYTLLVTNTGNVTLHAAIIDTLPPQVTSPGPLAWSPVIAAPNGVWTQQVTGTVQLGYSGPLTNVLRATSLEGATGMVTVTTQAATTPSLAVTKSAAPDPVQAGATLTYTLRVTNTGNVTLHAAITDTLPPQVTSPGPLTWSPLITAPNGVWTQQVTGTVQLGYSGPLTNVLRATTPEGATGMVTVTTQAATTPALAVHKSAAPDPVQAGATLTYTLLVTNTGNVTLHAAITDTLPPQVTSPGPLTWSPLIAAPNGVWTQQVTGTVQLGYSGPLTNVVRATSPEGATGMVTVTTQAATTPALAVHKSAAPDPVQAGATLTYTLLVTNTGNVALHAAITDTLPPQVTSPGPLTWSPLIAAPNGVWTQQVTGTVQLGYSGPLINVLRVTSPEGATGMATVTTQAATTPALAVTKSAAPDPVQAGATLTYTLLVTNTGNVALHAAVTDTLPPQVTSPGPLTWTDVALAPGVPWTQQVTGTVQLGYSGPLTNVLRATSPEGATGMVTVTTQAAVTPALAVTKSAAPDPVQAGATLTYTLLVTNTGNVTLHAAITDTLPPQVTSPGPLTWTDVALAPGVPWTQQVTGTVQLGYSGPLTNVLRATSPEGATGMVTVTTQAATTPALAVTKSAAPDPVQAGATLTYTLLVTNTGNVALHAAITDTLPPQVTSPGPLTWSPLIAAPNGVWTQQVTGTVQLGYSGPLTNVLRVTSPEGATGMVTVTTQAATTPALATHKSAAPDPVQAGATLTYTLLVTNTGNVTLHTAITDTLPPQVTSPGPLTWSPLIAAPNGVWTQQVTGTIQLGYSGPLTNVLRVTSLEGATGAYTATTQAATTPVLAVTKSAAPDPVQAGATLTYTLLVTNTGNVALHAAVTDTLPPQVTSPGPLTWSPLIAAPNGVWTQQVTGTVQLGYSGPLTNVLRVTSLEGATGAYTATTQAATTPALAVTKSAAPDPVQAGATLTYTLRVTNTGNVALHAAITDTLPPQVTSPGPLTWSPLIAAPNGVWTQQVTGTVQLGYSGPLTNVLRVTSPEGATGMVTVTTQAATTPALATHKSAAPDPVQAGATLTYTLLVTNTGNVTLHAAITDTLPPQVTSPGPLTWSPLIAAPNGVWTQQVTGTVQLGYSGPLTNVVRVTSLEGATGAYTATTQAAVSPALAVNKSATPDPVQAGTTLTYTLRVTNTGNVALHAAITDTLPPQVASPGPLTWSPLIAAPNGVWTQQVTGTVQLGYSGTLTNMIRVTTLEGATGMVTVTTQAATTPSLAVTKSAAPDPVQAGATLTYTLRVTNTGNVALHAAITDTLPAQVASPGPLTWTGVALAPGASWTQQVTGTVQLGYGGPLTNVLRVTSLEGATGAYTATTQAATTPSLAVHKSAAPDPVQAGATLTYTLRVTNTGNVALHAAITDTLPPQVTSPGPLTWSPLIAAPNGVWTQQVTGTVQLGYSGPLTNVLRVTSLEGATGAYAATTQAAVTPALAVSKSAAPDPVQAGATLTYTLRVTNTGNVTLHAAITDTLPPQVTSPGPLTWTGVALAPGATWTQQVTGTVQLGYSGPLTNVVRATTLEGASADSSAVSTVEPAPAATHDAFLPIIVKNLPAH